MFETFYSKQEKDSIKGTQGTDGFTGYSDIDRWLILVQTIQNKNVSRLFSGSFTVVSKLHKDNIERNKEASPVKSALVW